MKEIKEYRQNYEDVKENRENFNQVKLNKSKISKIKIAIFFIDASFDHKTRTASVGAYDIINKEEYSFVFKANNPTNAEMIGMRHIIEVAKNKKILDVIIVSDSKNGISAIKKEIYNETQIQKEKDALNDYAYNDFRIRYLQFLWIPREFNQIADMLSKNIHEKDVEAFQNIKADSLKDKKEIINQRVSKVYVKDVKYSKNLSGDALDLRIREFKSLCDVNNIKEDSFGSNTFKSVLNDIFDLDIIEANILDIEEMNLVENDISKFEENVLIQLSMNIIKDLLIFN